MLPSLSLLVGGGLSGNRLAAPVLSNGGSLDSSVGSVGLPNFEQSSVASGSFYNWGAALLLRQPLYDGGRAQSGAAVAERERDLLAADTDLARRRIRDTVSASWSSLQASDTVLNAARAGVVAGERALRDAQLRYRALVEPLTEVLACATGTAGGPGIPSDSPGPAIDRTGRAGAGDRNHGPGSC